MPLMDADAFSRRRVSKGGTDKGRIPGDAGLWHCRADFSLPWPTEAGSTRKTHKKTAPAGLTGWLARSFPSIRHFAILNIVI
jgi:hypothetical protein